MPGAYRAQTIRRAGGDKGVFANRHAANDRTIRFQRRAAPHHRLPVLILARHRRPRIIDIGEDHARPAEDVVLDLHGIVNGDVVLHLDVVADGHVIADEDVLAEGTAFPDPGPGANVGEVPDAAAVADLSALIDDRRWMDGHRHDQ